MQSEYSYLANGMESGEANDMDFRCFPWATLFRGLILFGHRLHPKAHVTVCIVESDVGNKCKLLFLGVGRHITFS